MPPFALLLRILLSVSLILNGIGTAVAATRMLVEHVATPHSKPVEATVRVAASGSCHHHENWAVTVRSAPADMAKDTGKSSHRSTDCCKSGQCGCACLQATPAAMVALSLPGAVLDRVATASPIKYGHASPAIPHLIRPPIG